MEYEGAVRGGEGVLRPAGNAVVERTRIVCLGGGTGLPAVLRGLSRRSAPRGDDPGLSLTAVVAMSDDGGSSGRLKRTRGLLPPGDIRNCLVAMSDAKGPMTELFQHRFLGKELGGHAMGNLFIAALTELRGDFLEAIKISGKLLGVQGAVLPSTLARVELEAELFGGAHVLGERNIVRAGAPIRRVQLRPERPPPAAGILEAMLAADLVTLGPGSLFSSVLPNLLVDGVADVLKRSRGLKVLVGNLMTEPGETDGMTGEAHVRAVLDHVGPVVDVVLLNGAEPAPEALERYERAGSHRVRTEAGALRDMGVIPIVADLARAGRRIRHDSEKLARCLLKLARWGV